MIPYQLGKVDIFIANPGFYLLHLEGAEGGNAGIAPGDGGLFADSEAMLADLGYVSRYGCLT